jgi:hypothetical protein
MEVPQRNDCFSRVRKALEEIDCEKYIKKFKEEEINWKAFLELNKGFLLDRMKIPLGRHRS